MNLGKEPECVALVPSWSFPALPACSENSPRWAPSHLAGFPAGPDTVRDACGLPVS